MDLSKETVAALTKDIEKALNKQTKLEAFAVDTAFACEHRAVLTELVVGLVTLVSGKVAGASIRIALDWWFNKHCDA